MTSSPPEEEEQQKVPGWRQPWDPWRILMFTGSMILLVLVLTRGGEQDRFPAWFDIGVQAIGYALVAIGFFLAMRTRRELREKHESEEKKKKVSPRDPG